MKDLNKWLVGIGTTALIALVGIVFRLGTTVERIGTTQEITNKNVTTTLNIIKSDSKLYSTQLNSHESRIRVLELQNRIDDVDDNKYHDKTDSLLTYVKSIELMMKESQYGN